MAHKPNIAEKPSAAEAAVGFGETLKGFPYRYRSFFFSLMHANDICLEGFAKNEDFGDSWREPDLMNALVQKCD